MERRSFLAALLALAAGLAAGPAPGGRRSDNPEACDRLDRRLRDIAAERRAGYTAKRGRKLQAQRQALEDQRRLKCG